MKFFLLLPLLYLGFAAAGDMTPDAVFNSNAAGIPSPANLKKTWFCSKNEFKRTSLPDYLDYLLKNFEYSIRPPGDNDVNTVARSSDVWAQRSFSESVSDRAVESMCPASYPLVNGQPTLKQYRLIRQVNDKLYMDDVSEWLKNSPNYSKFAQGRDASPAKACISIDDVIKNLREKGCHPTENFKKLLDDLGSEASRLSAAAQRPSFECTHCDFEGYHPQQTPRKWTERILSRENFEKACNYITPTPDQVAEDSAVR